MAGLIPARPRPPLAAPARAAGDSEALGLRELIALAFRRWKLLAACAAAGGLAGYGLGQALPPAYTAEGLLVIDTRELNVPELQAVRSTRTAEPWGARSEARALTSRELVGGAVDRLGLAQRPGYGVPAADGPSALAPLWRAAAATEWLPGPVREGARERLDAPPDRPGLARAKAVEEVLDDLEALSEERSYAIELTYQADDPELAAAVVNTLMDLYVERERQDLSGAAAGAAERLAPQVERLSAELAQTRARLRELEAGGAALATGQGTLAAQAAAALAEERRLLEAERASLEADLAQVEAALARGQANVLNPDLVTPRLKALQETTAELESEMAESGVELGPRHPRMVALENELDGVRAEALAELDALADSLRGRATALSNQAARLDARLAEAGTQAGAAAGGRSEAAALEAKAESQEQLLALYRERLERTLLDGDALAADARVIGRAVPPLEPSSPPPLLLGLAGAAFGGAGGAAWALGRRFLRDTAETPDEVGFAAGLPTLGAVPDLGRANRPGRLAAFVVRHPYSAVTETVRGILFRLQGGGGGGGEPGPKVVLVTSPNPRDGKSSLVSALARVASWEGLRCLAIDCDFRKPSLAAALGVEPGLRLNDHLDELAPLEDVVTHDVASGAHFLLARPVAHCSRQFLEQPRLERLIERAREEYDLVLIDTPPVMRVVDPLVLARHADALVLAVARRGASRTVLREAVARLSTARTPLAGVVVSRVESGKAAEGYVYGGYGPNEA